MKDLHVAKASHTADSISAEKEWHLKDEDGSPDAKPNATGFIKYPAICTSRGDGSQRWRKAGPLEVEVTRVFSSTHPNIDDHPKKERTRQGVEVNRFNDSG